MYMQILHCITHIVTWYFNKFNFCHGHPWHFSEHVKNLLTYIKVLILIYHCTISPIIQWLIFQKATYNPFLNMVQSPITCHALSLSQTVGFTEKNNLCTIFIRILKSQQTHSKIHNTHEFYPKTSYSVCLSLACHKISFHVWNQNFLPPSSMISMLTLTSLFWQWWLLPFITLHAIFYIPLYILPLIINIYPHLIF